MHMIVTREMGEGERGREEDQGRDEGGGDEELRGKNIYEREVTSKSLRLSSTGLSLQGLGGGLWPFSCS